MIQITRIPLEGAGNTRDLGGIPARSGMRIREKRLIRSGELFPLTERDKEILIQDYGLSCVIDFRTAAERQEKPDPGLQGVKYIENPILKEEAMGITREEGSGEELILDLMKRIGAEGFDSKAYMAGLYENLVGDAYSRAQYKNFFNVLTEQEKGAVLWHCSAGKDRAGVGTALLLTALGADREDIIQDYMAANEYLKESIEALTAKIEEKLQNPSMEKAIRALFSVEENYIRSIFTKMEEISGTAERFLEQEMGLTPVKMEKLRNFYLEWR